MLPAELHPAETSFPAVAALKWIEPPSLLSSALQPEARAEKDTGPE